MKLKNSVVVKMCPILLKGVSVTRKTFVLQDVLVFFLRSTKNIDQLFTTIEPFLGDIGVNNERREKIRQSMIKDQIKN